MRNMYENSDGKKSVHSALSSEFYSWEKIFLSDEFLSALAKHELQKVLL